MSHNPAAETGCHRNSLRQRNLGPCTNAGLPAEDFSGPHDQVLRPGPQHGIGARLEASGGLSLALLAALCVEGLITTPRVVRAARGRGRHRPAGSRGRHRQHIRSSLTIGAARPSAGATAAPPAEQWLAEEAGYGPGQD